jgi:hypothetical protein
VVEESTILPSDTSSTSRALVIEDGHIALGGCAAVPVKLKAGKNGTRVAGRWRSCPAYAGKLHLTGTIDPTCRTFSGTLSGKKPKLHQSILAALDKLRGNLSLTATVVVPEAARADIVAQRSLIETEGGIVAPDGSGISQPPEGAGGWLVKVGDNQARTQANGDFFIHVPPTASDAQLFHPSDDSTVVYTFPTNLLVPPGTTPTPIDLELRMDGPCGMNAADNSDPTAHPPGCSATAPTTMLASRAGSFGIQPDGVEPRDNPPGPAQTTGPLGTYPAGRQTQCLDYDGANHDRTTVAGVLIDYVGSTCYRRIHEGCCGNELGSLWVSAKSVFGFTPKECSANHKGRFCQEVTKGDIAIQTPTHLASPAAIAAIRETLPGGGSLPITVHNNGCYGATHVEEVQDALGGGLEGFQLDHGTLEHWDLPGGKYLYVPDRTLTYTAPRCPQKLSAADVYTFETDGAQVTLEIHVDCSLPTTTTSTSATTTSTTTTLPCPFILVTADFGVTGGSLCTHVDSSPPGISCSQTCTAHFGLSGTVQLTATDVGAQFSGDCDSSGRIDLSRGKRPTCALTCECVVPGSTSTSSTVTTSSSTTVTSTTTSTSTTIPCLGQRAGCGPSDVCCAGLDCRPDYASSLTATMCLPPCPLAFALIGDPLTVTQPSAPTVPMTYNELFYDLIGGPFPACLSHASNTGISCARADRILDLSTLTDLTNPAWPPITNPDVHVDWAVTGAGFSADNHAEVGLVFYNYNYGGTGGATKQVYLVTDFNCH